MTAISDALKKAGVKTAHAQAYTAACGELRKHDMNTKKALGGFVTILMKTREVRDAVCLDYLERCAADMAAKPAGAESQKASDTQSPAASAPAPSSNGNAASSAKLPAKAKAKPKKPQRQTASQREAERRSMRTGAEALFDHYLVGDQVGSLVGIGNVTFGEISELISHHATSAANKLTIGKKQTVDAILLQEIEKRYPSTFVTKIRERVPADDLPSLIQAADTKARALITNAMRVHRNAIMHEGLNPNA